MSSVSRIMVEETVSADTSILPKYSETADLEAFLTEDIDIEDELFQSSRFFITGFTPRHIKMIKTIIRKGGGYIFDSLTPSITHLICARQNAETNRDVIHRNNMTGTKPIVINIYWIMECIHIGDAVDEKRFLVADMNGSFKEYNRSASEVTYTEPKNQSTPLVRANGKPNMNIIIL